MIWYLKVLLIVYVNIEELKRQKEVVDKTNYIYFCHVQISIVSVCKEQTTIVLDVINIWDDNFENIA